MAGAAVLAALAVLTAACGTSGETATAPAGTQATAPAGTQAGAQATASAGAGHAGHAGHGGHGAEATAEPAPLRPGESFTTLRMAAPYTPQPPNGGTDDYRCFLIDPGLTGDRFLTGGRFLPQNRAIVHHAIVYRLSPEQAKEAAAFDEKSPGQGWTCFGNAGVGHAEWVAQWAPGTEEVLLDARYGHPLPKGSMLVMQVHYNTLGAGAGRPVGTDRSGIRLRLSDRRLEPLRTTLLAAPVELPCTPAESGPLCDRQAALADLAERFGDQSLRTVEGLALLCGGLKPPAPGPTQYCDRPVSEAGKVHAMIGHMHLLGRSIKVELNPGTPGARTLLDVPQYDFDDQALRPLPEPVPVEPGDTLRVTCTHDAGLRAMLPQLQQFPPRYVVWGEGTGDEMCLGVVIMSK